MPSIDKILESESQNNGSFIRLYSKGAFYKAYERSAWLACMYLGSLLIRKRFVKKVNLEVTSEGFPKISLGKWTGGRKIETHDDYLTIILEDSEIMEYSDEKFHKWKNSSGNHDERKGENDSNEFEEIHDRILSFPIENKTPMECTMLLSELKVLLNAKN